MYVCPPVSVLEEMPEGMVLDLLLIGLRQTFAGEAKLGATLVHPRRIALRLIADGYSPGTARWMIREGRISACINEIR